MMDSFFARNRLSAYLDHSLPRAEAIAVAEAVARDISLSADLLAMKQALNLLNDDGPKAAPPGFKARTMALIAKKPVSGSQVAWIQRRLARVPTEFVAVLGAGLIVLVAINHDKFGTQAASPAKSPTQAMADPPLEAPPKAQTPAPAPEPSGNSQAKAQAQPTATGPKPKRATVKPDSVPVYDPAKPLAYRILHGGDQVLYDIATLADQAGGRLVDVHGKLFIPHSLNEARSFRQLYLVTPLSTAATTHTALVGRSGMAPYTLDGPKPPLSADETVFLIEAQL
jgi:hypothetical protein